MVRNGSETPVASTSDNPPTSEAASDGGLFHSRCRATSRACLPDGFGARSFQRLLLVLDLERPKKTAPASGGANWGRLFIGCDGGTLHPVAYYQVISATLVPSRLVLFSQSGSANRSRRLTM